MPAPMQRRRTTNYVATGCCHQVQDEEGNGIFDGMPLPQKVVFYTWYILLDHILYFYSSYAVVEASFYKHSRNELWKIVG